MGRVERAPQAEIDLTEIFTHIAEDDIVAAEGVLRSIGATCELLADNPGMGRERPELPGSVRSFPISSYLIFYRPIADGIEVARVLHGARDIDRIF